MTTKVKSPSSQIGCVTDPYVYSTISHSNEGANSGIEQHRHTMYSTE